MNARIFSKIQTDTKLIVHAYYCNRNITTKAIKPTLPLHTKKLSSPTNKIISGQHELDKFVTSIHKTNKKIQQQVYKNTLKQNQLRKINRFQDILEGIASYLCTDWFAIEQQSVPDQSSIILDTNSNNNITELFGVYNMLSDSVYKIWYTKPEVDDPIYGLDPDCECPYLFVHTNKLMLKLYDIWGYLNEREIRHRCAMFSYMKAQRRCALMQFWEIFDLQDNFLVELQILAIHLWIIKTRMNHFNSPICNELSYETFRIMFNEFGVRFEKHISGSRIRWESDCQHACLYLAVALDEVWDNYTRTSLHQYNPYIFAKVIWTEIYLLNENVSLDVLYLWSKYIFDEMNNLRSVNDFDFLNGWWTFGELPTIENRKQTENDIKQFMKMYNGKSNIDSSTYEVDRQQIPTDVMFNEILT
eukprot:142725_1